MNHCENPTIDDLARALGVSKTTVSRALSGKGRISDATRTRVLEYAEAHNYMPNASAKGLAERRTFNLALVIPHSYLELDLSCVRASVRAICREAYAFDYNILFCMTTEQKSDPLIRTLDRRKADAVILTRPVENDLIAELLIRRGIPFATLGSLPQRYRGKATVEADHRLVEGCREFTRLFLEGKSGKSALLGDDLGYVINQNRLTGAALARKDLEIGLEQSVVRVGLHTQEDVTQAVTELLDSGVHRFLCMDNEICVQVLIALSAMGLAAGTDAEVASLCDSPLLQGHKPPISALACDCEALGQTACRQLLLSLRGEPYDPAPRLRYEIHMR